MPNEVRPAACGHAIVTGSSSGIGRAVAARLLDDGWRVSGIDLAAPTLRHSDFTHHRIDLTDGGTVGTCLAGLPAAQALVHAAGILRVGALGGLDHADGERMWRLHVEAATRLAEAVAPAMAARGHGRLVLIGSRVAHGMPGRGQYAASKAALVALARSWGSELAAHGVTVNVVAPAATDTAMLADPARAGAPPRLPPLGRLIRPAEVAALVAYLLSSDAAAITGQDIAICGGASLPRSA